MKTYVKTDAKGLHEISISAMLMQKRILVIHGEITSQTANDFIQALAVLLFESPSQPIRVLLTTNGGDVDAGLLMYDAMISSSCPVYTYALDCVYSMGFILLLAGDKSFMFPNSKLMIHRPRQMGTQGMTEDLLRCTNTLRHYESLFISIISKRTGQSKKTIRAAINYDHYYSAKEALNIHLIDEIVGMDHILKTGDVYEGI